MAKSDRILQRFPAFFRAGDATKLLHHVVAELGAPLDEADTHLLRIQRAHRILVAEDAGDIVRLAAALNLTSFHFEDLTADAALPYAQRLERMKERVKRVARLHLLGLGTPWAVLEAAAIFLSGRIVPEREGEPLITHLDARHLSHKAVIQQDTGRERIYLHEGLFRRRRVERTERWQLASWSVSSTDPEASPARFVVQAVGDHTVRPAVFCPRTGEGFWFDGAIPEGSTLVIDPYAGALLDDQPVDEWLVVFRGGIQDFAPHDTAPFVVERGGGALAPFLGDAAEVVVSATRDTLEPPAVPPGRSEWFYKVAEGLYDASDFDLAVFDPPTEPIGVFDGDLGWDRCVFDHKGAGIVGMAWDESIPCAFKLLLPPRPEGDGAEATTGAGDVPRIAAILPRFKAAGVRAIVDTARDAWILGESVLRDGAASAGEGLVRHATRLHDPGSDRYVPLDTASAGTPA